MDKLSGPFMEAAAMRQQQADENAAIAGQNKALETVLRTYGNNLGVSADDIDAYTAPSADQSPRQRNAYLNQLLQGAVMMNEQRKQQQQMQLMQQQIGQYQQQQAQYAQAQASTARANQSADDIVAAYNQMQRPSGNGTGVYSPQFQSEVAGRINSLPVQYRAQGGDLTPQVQQAFATFAAKNATSGTPFMPEYVDLGNGVTAMTTSRNSAVPLAKGTVGVNQALQKQVIGGKTYYVGPGNRYFDESGAPVDFSFDKPMSSTDWIWSGQKPEDYKAYRDSYRVAMRDVNQQPGASGPWPIGGGPVQFGAPAPPKSSKSPDNELRPRRIPASRHAALPHSG